MPGYGILPADAGEGLLPFAWAEERLARARSYWVATVGAEDAPHLAPVWGVWLDGEFFFSTGRRSAKVRHLMRMPRCVISADGAEEAVIMHGTAHEVDDPATLARLGAAYVAKYDVNVTSMDEPIFRVRPERAFGFVDSGERFTASATRWTWV